VPVDVILDGWVRIYGKDHIKARIEELERGEGRSSHNFDKEDVVKV